MTTSCTQFSAILLVIACLAGAQWQTIRAQETAFLEKEGLIVIQAESVELASHWVTDSTEAGHTGSGYIRWDGDDDFGNPSMGMLAYLVYIENPGAYNVRFRMSHLGASAGDQENDVWVRMDSGSWVKVVHPSNRRDEGFTFHSPTEPSAGVFGQMRYTLSAGPHTIYISGRSYNARIDRIHFYRDGTNNPLDLAHPESETVLEDMPDEGAEITVRVDGEFKKWHPVTVTLDGPEADEMDARNPFLNYRFDVIFSQGDRSFRIPGYFAADGDAGESSADAGNRWRAHFTPVSTGTWRYQISFRTGSNVAIHQQPNPGTAAIYDGFTGEFEITDTDKTGRDHRSKGILRYVGKHYLQFDNGEYFLKGGANSPENFLAYADFDSTYSVKKIDFIKTYTAHVADWTEGDPTWQTGKGKGIIGALNYLSSKGMNSVYFITMNVNGDGEDIWPWTSHAERYRFDVSKLDQWNVVFDHMDRKGIMLHILLQETENETLLDGGELGVQRKLYFRELIARFGHHHAITWNLGEENDENTVEQRKAFASYIRNLDAYNHPIVIHTFPGQYDDVYGPMLGFPDFEGPSLQLHGMADTYRETLKWYRRSAENGRPWIVSLDEFGPFDVGVTEDGPESNHDDVRRFSLWPNLMAGGAGVEWYFGYETASNDLNNEDWRSRSTMWDYTRHAIDFYRQYLPFSDMQPADNLTNRDTAYVFADSGQVYAIYFPAADSVTVNLPPGEYSAHWYNPRTGGELVQNDTPLIYGTDRVPIGQPPADPAADWVLLLQKTTAQIAYPILGVAPVEIDFGSVQRDSSYTFPVELSNLGTAPLTIDSLSFRGEHATFFMASTNAAAGFTIAEGLSQSILVSLTPDSTLLDAVFASLDVHSDDPVHPVRSVSIQGFFEPPDAPLDATSVVAFTLIDADTEQEIAALRDGMTVDLSKLPPHLNIRAEVRLYERDILQYVSFELAPIDIKRKESIAPYALFGDLGGNFAPGTFNSGENTLRATPFIKNSTSGVLGRSLEVTFDVIGNNKTSARIAPGAQAELVEEASGFEDTDEHPDSFRLDVNYPNPFNPVTTIPLSVPASSPVKLVVYDMLGRIIRTLIDETIPAGRHQILFEAFDLPSGTYLYKLETPEQSFTRKMLLLR